MTTLKILFWLCLALVFYTYLGYAVVLWALVRLKRLFGFQQQEPQLPDDDSQLPRVTLMICAYNEATNDLLAHYPEITLVYRW